MEAATKAGGTRSITVADWRPPSSTATWRPAAAWSTSPARRSGSTSRSVSSTCRRAQARPLLRHSGAWAGPRRGGADALPFYDTSSPTTPPRSRTCQARSTIIADDASGTLDDAYLYHFAAERPARRERQRLATTLPQAEQALDGSNCATYREITMRLQAGRAVSSSALEQEGFQPASQLLPVVDSGRRGVASVAPATPANHALLQAVHRHRATFGTVGPTCWPAGDAGRPGRARHAAPRSRLPLYGFELARDEDGADVPIFSIPLAKLAVSPSRRLKASPSATAPSPSHTTWPG